MGRWEPDARGRLEQAAMELFEERGYAGTTVEDIAARAGLTERTFFRYFTDKREVLFSGSAALEALIVKTIGAAPTSVAPLTAVTKAFEALAPWFESRRGHARKRRTVIAAYAELGERELIKLSALAAAIAANLRKRGLAAPTAALVAETGIAIFKNAFERWADDTRAQNFAVHVGAAVAALQAATAGMVPQPSSSRGNAVARRARPKVRR
ncbi:MAG TPA: TetR family transcriptional regulator [Vicinamibacterales bacterium]|jgi:AcrR family transcriptional regulator|nr:TetR family transcriptional regulator [Vicinamibacterales bacterium]